MARAGGGEPPVDIEMAVPPGSTYYGAAYTGEKPTTEEPMFAGGGGGTFRGAGVTGTWEEPSGEPHVQSFQDYFNYAATLYKKTGEKLPQREAYAKLKSMGWTG